MNILANFHTDKEKWLEERAKGLTASDASAVLGLSPFKTPFQVWADKTKVIDNTFEESERMKWGSRLEAGIALGFAEEFKLEIEASGDLVAHEDVPWLMATPDFYVSDGSLLEIKNTFKFWEWQDNNTPDNAHVQVVIQLACTGKELGHIGALIQGSKLEHRIIFRDFDLENAIIAKLADFKELIDTRTPPALQSEDLGTVAEMYKQANPNMHELLLDESWMPRIESYLERKEKFKSDEEYLKLEEAKFKQTMGTAGSARCGDYSLKWSNVSSNRLDTKMFKEARPELYNQFCVPSMSRRFSISKKALKTK